MTLRTLAAVSALAVLGTALVAGCDASAPADDPALDKPFWDPDAPPRAFASADVEGVLADDTGANADARLSGGRTLIHDVPSRSLTSDKRFFVYVPSSTLRSGVRYTARIDVTSGDADLMLRPLRSADGTYDPTRTIRQSIAPARESDIVHFASSELRSGERAIAFAVKVEGGSSATFSLKLYREDVGTPPMVLYPLPGAFKTANVNLAFKANWPYSAESCQGVQVPKWHSGTDLKATRSTSVYAVASGTVRYIRSQGDWKTAVVVEHPHLGMLTSYLHTDPRDGLKVGQSVSAGQRVANVAALGSGDHLHFGAQTGAWESSNDFKHALGGLSKTTVPCGSQYPVFPWRFVDPASGLDLER